MISQEALHDILRRYDDVNATMARPEIATDPDRMAALGREHVELHAIAQNAERYLKLIRERDDLRTMIEAERDSELLEMVRAEIEQIDERLSVLEAELQLQLIPRDPADSHDVIMEIRAGTGGDEAALFAGDLFRLYMHFAEQQGWQIELIDRSEGTQGGYKEIIFAVKGTEAYGMLKFESGVHRVQRVPATEASGRIHTSAATVAVLPEAEEVDVNINAQDLKIDVYRSSGPGGQSVNTTDSAVRITHIPTGLVVTCQDEKSQHKNKDKALRVLRSRLYEMELARQHAERDQARRSMVGTGDRSAKIRTYNFPQDRVTDHRLQGDDKNYPLHQVVDGELGPIIRALRLADSAEKMARI